MRAEALLLVSALAPARFYVGGAAPAVGNPRRLCRVFGRPPLAPITSAKHRPEGALLAPRRQTRRPVPRRRNLAAWARVPP